MPNPATLIEYEEPLLASWTYLELNTQLSGRFLKTELYMALNLLQCRKKASETTIQQRGWKPCSYIGLRFAKTGLVCHHIVRSVKAVPENIVSLTKS